MQHHTFISTLAKRLLAGAFPLLFWPVASHAAAVGSGELSIESPTLEFSGSTSFGFNPTGMTGAYPCSSSLTQCDNYTLDVSLPADFATSEPDAVIRITLNWEFTQDNYDLYLYDKVAAGEKASSSTNAAPEVIEIPAGAGTQSYRVDIVPVSAYLNSYSGTVELVSSATSGGGGGGGETGGGGNSGGPIEVSPTAKPRVVVAVPDTGINPYHAFLYAGSPIYPAGSPPNSVTAPLLAELGIGSDCWIKLTRTGNFASDYAADVDSGLWAKAKACNMVWFVGTNVVSKSFDAGSTAFMPDSEDDTHGVGTSSAVLAANPEAVVMFIEGTSDAAVSFVMNNPVVDMVSTSFGPVGSIPLPGNLTDSYKGVYTNGKLHFGACDNSPSTAVQDSTCGPWWSIGIAGIEETQENEPVTSSNGRQPVSGTLPDFIADFTQTLPYCKACEDGYEDYVGGTSFATPRSAGTASKILLMARKQFGQLSGITSDNGRPAMAVGVTNQVRHSITNWQLRRALEEAAWVPGVGDYDPSAALLEYGPGVPIPPGAPWLLIGWGVLTTSADAHVVDGTLVQLGLAEGTPATKDAGFCNFQNNLIVSRKYYWDYVNFGSETFMNAPSPDPYLYCDSAAAQLAGSGSPAPDQDADGVADEFDNCPSTVNGTQSDSDHDGAGDACDADDDNDGVVDGSDLCPGTPAGATVGSDGCEGTEQDADNDGVVDGSDNCPNAANPDQKDTDGDGIGDACDNQGGDPGLDQDGDGVPNASDNCPFVTNSNQKDTDGDGAGDACDTVNNADSDGDGIAQDVDNCPTTANPGQEDGDGDGAGDACDSVDNQDPDEDGVAQDIDNCPNVSNPDQGDADGDGIGDACDSTGNTDMDGDGVVNGLDNCPTVPNPDQQDSDGDGAGDSCDNVNNVDKDGDGIANANDNCPAAPNTNQADGDGDGIGDVCDSINDVDQDDDGVEAAVDNCPMVSNPDQADTDGDGKGDACDSVNNLDDDGDGVLNADDNCRASPNPDQADADGDGIGDVCDAVDNDDLDGDGVANALDNCPKVPNASQSNADGDSFGDACDADQGNGGGQAKSANAGTVQSSRGASVKVGEVRLINTSAVEHRVNSVQVQVDAPGNLSRLWATAQGVHFTCSTIVPLAGNVCSPDVPVSIQSGQTIAVEVWTTTAE